MLTLFNSFYIGTIVYILYKGLKNDDERYPEVETYAIIGGVLTLVNVCSLFWTL